MTNSCYHPHRRQAAEGAMTATNGKEATFSRVDKCTVPTILGYCSFFCGERSRRVIQNSSVDRSDRNLKTLTEFCIMTIQTPVPLAALTIVLKIIKAKDLAAKDKNWRGEKTGSDSFIRIFVNRREKRHPHRPSTRHVTPSTMRRTNLSLGQRKLL